MEVILSSNLMMMLETARIILNQWRSAPVSTIWLDRTKTSEHETQEYLHDASTAFFHEMSDKRFNSSQANLLKLMKFKLLTESPFTIHNPSRVLGQNKNTVRPGCPNKQWNPRLTPHVHLLQLEESSKT